MKQIFLLINAFIILLVSDLFAQGKPYEGPEDPAGDISALRAGYMTGNRVKEYFENAPYIGEWGKNAGRTSRWPNNYDGTIMLDQIFTMFGSEVYIYQDSIPITDPAEIARLQDLRELETLYYIQTHAVGGKADWNYEKTVGWQFYPVPGYFNETQDYPAMSNKPDSWPLEGWPSTGFERKWQGEWNGRFGRGVQYADFETYFVANDAQDLENIVVRNDPEQSLIMDTTRYHPRPGKFIGDINPSVTVQKGFPWGGLGLRVGVRGFQWNNPEARDMIFWEYDISNVSDYDLPVAGLGIYLGSQVGGTDEDNGYFDTFLDMAYVWDWDGIGLGGRVPGTLGMAYLESPGLAYDGMDNDEDGLVDEQRDNPAGELIGPYDGIDNLDKFLKFYSLKEEALYAHYEGDEDQDWQDGTDINGDGNYSYYDETTQMWNVDEGESPGDDVGLDGVGPMDLNYTGPDEGECNHKPDFVEGVGCEPNFAFTDVSESDMLGLTSFNFFNMGEWQTYGWTPAYDKNMWDLMNDQDFADYVGDPTTLYFVFASTKFPLYQGRTERISLGMLYAYESLHDLSGPGHPAPNLFKLKDIAQIIYEADYRFAQPPKMPTLTATAGDGKVILSWDNVSDKLTREPFLGNINDFEGYKLYRATDKLFSDAEIVTNSQGVKMFKKPIFQCDLIDSVSGHASYGVVGGAEFYLGDNTGISHYYIDEQVQNGKTYYYALAAYDYGAPHIGTGISPAENNIVMELDEAEEIIRMGENVVVVTPRQNAAGFQQPSLTYDKAETIGNAKVTPTIYDKDKIKPGHTYQVKFNADTVGHIKRNEKDRNFMDVVFVNNGLKVYDVTEGGRLVYKENKEIFPLQNIIERDDKHVHYLSGQSMPFKALFYVSDDIYTDVFDGIQLRFEGLNGYLPQEPNQPMPAAGFNQETTGWIIGDAPITIKESKYEYYGFPYKYDIIFTDNDSAFVNRLNKKTGIKNLDGGGGNFIFDQSFSFYVLNQTASAVFGEPDTMELIVEDVNQNGSFDILEDRIVVGAAAVRPVGAFKIIGWGGTVFGFDFNKAEDESQLPKADYIYRLDFSRPFFTSDSITFTVNDIPGLVKSQLKSTMDDIKVVPNPYIMTNSMEPAVGNKFLNQRRRIMFTHIPARCEIHIFTSSGVLVDKIEVGNDPGNGVVHWDLLSKEDLEIAAGMYIYHVESKETGKEKLGKFAVIK